MFDWSQALAAAILDRAERALAFVRVAEAKALMGRTSSAREAISRAISSALLIGGDGDIARPVTKRRLDDEIPCLHAETLVRIAESQVAMGDSDRARETLALARSAAGAIESDYWRTDARILIARVQAAAGALQSARDSVSEAIAGDANPLFDEQLRETAAAQANAGDIEGALATVEAMRSNHDRNRVLAAIAGAQARDGDDDGALATVRRIRGIDDAYFRMLAMHDIGVARARRGDVEQAMRAAQSIRNLFEASFAFSRDMEILYSDTLMAIAEAHVAAGSPEKALSLSAEMLDGWSIVTTRAAVAEAQIEAGDLEAARAAAEAMFDPRHGDAYVEVLASLASAYAEAGDLEAASEAMAAATQPSGEVRYVPRGHRAFAAIWEARARMGDAQASRLAFDHALAAAGGDMDAPADALLSLVASATRMMAHGEDTHALSAALAATERIEAPHARVRALALVGSALSRAGDLQGAQRALSRALSTASSMDSDVIGRVAVLVDIVPSLAIDEPWANSDLPSPPGTARHPSKRPSRANHATTEESIPGSAETVPWRGRRRAP